MESRLLHLSWAGILMFASGLMTSAWSQQPGPLPPVPANEVDQQAPTQAAPPTSAAAPAPATAAPAASPNPNATIRVPSGTHIPLLLHTAISTRSAKPGDPVYFETLFPIMVDGRVVIPAGSYVSGEVTESKRPGRVKGRAQLMARLNTLILPNGYLVNLNASPGGSPGTGGRETMNDEGKVIGDSDKTGDIGTVATTTVEGAGIGAIASRSGTGAGIGAGIGAVTGLAAVLLTRGPEAELPRGTTLEAVLDRPILLDASKVQFTSPGQASTLAGPPNREPQRTRTVPF
jgi:type IV secretion system protein VirB10